MRAAVDQAKTACGNLQLCAGLEAGIEGATHAVGQRILERVRGRQCEEEESEAADEGEEESEGVANLLNNLDIDTAVTEEEAAEGLEATLGMEVEEDRDSEGKEGGDGTLMSMGDLQFLTQDA